MSVVAMPSGRGAAGAPAATAAEPILVVAAGLVGLIAFPLFRP